MHSENANPPLPHPLCELNRIEDVGGFGLRVGGPFVVHDAILESEVVVPHGAIAVRIGGHIDDAAAGGEFAEDAVGEDEVAEVVGGELGLEAVGRFAVGRGHDAGVVDEDVDVEIIL